MATMGPWSRVRVAKCQMLVTSFFVLGHASGAPAVDCWQVAVWAGCPVGPTGQQETGELLGLSAATLAALTYFGAHFAVIGRASSDKTPYEAMHRWAFYTTSSLAGLLALGAVLGAVATVREAGGLMAGVEDAVLDVYDLAYEWAARNLSGAPRQQLVAIQDTNIRLVTAQCELKQGPVATGSQPGRQGPQFLCCGKSSPFGLLGDVEASLCRGQQAARQDCLQEIRSFLTMHRNIACALTGTGLALTVYAMLLSSFLWFAIRSGGGLDRKCKYT
ncbi:tetraspanin-32 isoform X2 [Mustela putorius furo]|uniref:Tetraspanin-32 isoform X2 n=1 Tax=Mustela putorius furo TaxID=9669 RepID=A0A8U0RFU8_MUSPF|nr:tetraspanin-32 isoform X2 [Mustela putorius furo]